MSPSRAVLAIALAAAVLTGCGRATFTDLDGHSVQFADYRGRWVFINYWATWCHPCRAEVPQLNRFAREHQTTVQVVGVNFDGLGTPRLDTAAAALGIDYTVLRQDPAAALGLQRPRALPVTYVLNPAGKLVATLTGAQTDGSLVAAMQQLGQ